MKYRKEVAIEYAKRGFGNTDQIAFDCITTLSYLRDKNILDLGTGSGRSARFLKQLGNQVTGLDISTEMVEKAREEDPEGHYVVMEEGSPFPFYDQSFDVVFSSWMILELSSKENINAVFRECHRVLKSGGYFLIITNTPDFYQHRWVSIDVNHPENTFPLQSGQRVKATLLPEKVIVHDYYWSDQDYRDCLQESQFLHMETLHPRGHMQDGIPWKDEVHYAPYAIYIARVQ